MSTTESKLPEFLAACETLDECLTKVYNYVSYLPFKDDLHNYIHDQIYSQKDVEPDLYYTQVRQFVILPPSLVGCIREELRCQALLDAAEARRQCAALLPAYMVPRVRPVSRVSITSAVSAVSAASAARAQQV